MPATMRRGVHLLLHAGVLSVVQDQDEIVWNWEVAMAAEPKRKAYAGQTPADLPTVLPFTPLVELDHLLKVAGSVSQDANQIWAEMWGEFRRIVTGSGMIVPEAAGNFVPACGWPEFLEKFWLLKHYLDSIQRICERRQ